MTGDLPKPDQAAAQQAYEAAARLYDEAATEPDRAAAHCRVAAGHFRGAEVPRGTAHAWAALGQLARVAGLSHRTACAWSGVTDRTERP